MENLKHYDDAERGIMEADNRCVCCGEIIPEGRMICWGCEKGYAKKG